MPEFLYKIQPTRLEMLQESTPEEDEIIGRHFHWLQAQGEQGVVLLAGRTIITDERTFGIVIFRADSEEAAQAFAAQDPAVRHGVMQAELYPFRTAILSDTYPRS